MAGEDDNNQDPAPPQQVAQVTASDLVNALQSLSDDDRDKVAAALGSGPTTGKSTLVIPFYSGLKKKSTYSGA